MKHNRDGYYQEVLSIEELKAKYPNFTTSCNVHHLPCASCGEHYNLRPSLCPPCLERSLRSDGPYRTPAPRPEEDPIEALLPLPPPAYRDRLLDARWYALASQHKRDVAELKSALDFEMWRFKRMRVVAVMFAIGFVILGIFLKICRACS